METVAIQDGAQQLAIIENILSDYRTRGKIRWAKLSRFSRVPRKFFREYS